MWGWAAESVPAPTTAPSMWRVATAATSATSGRKAALNGVEATWSSTCIRHMAQAVTRSLGARFPQRYLSSRKGQAERCASASCGRRGVTWGFARTRLE